MLELDHIRCVLAVAETRSFSRTAERLGIAQSAVTKKVQRVEQQLHLSLFARTSRSVELTREGVAFLPHAQAMVDAEQAARNAAQLLRTDHDNLLILGTYNFLFDERQALMDRCLKQFPTMRIEVVYGSRAELLAALRVGAVDSAVIVGLPMHVEPDMTAIKLNDRVAHLRVPRGHPLFAREAVKAQDFAGLEMVFSPTRQDDVVRAAISGRLIHAGATLINAPEAHRETMETFSQLRGLPMLHWAPFAMARTEIGDAAIIQISGLNLFTELVVYVAAESSRPSVAGFEAFVRQLAAAETPICPAIADRASRSTA